MTNVIVIRRPIIGNYTFELIKNTKVIIHSISLYNHRIFMLSMGIDGTLWYMYHLPSSNDILYKFKNWKKRNKFNFKGLDIPDEEIFALFLLEFV